MLNRTMSASLLLLACLSGNASEDSENTWQVLPVDQTRLKSRVINKIEPATSPVELDKDGIYEPGQGSMEGAFGILFGAPVEPGIIVQDLGWQDIPVLPAKYKYYGTIKPFNLPAHLFKPPSEPAILKSLALEYRVYTNFEQHPIWISTSLIPNLTEVLAVLERKYGPPDEISPDRITYQRDAHLLHINRKANRGSLNYYDLGTLETYLRARNLPLKKKFNVYADNQLTPAEREVLALADQFVDLRRNIGTVFGQAFGKRVGFRATPDEFVSFEPPSPLQGIDSGEYKIMVNPDLIPIAVRYEITGAKPVLKLSKEKLDLALDIAFGGFLKNTERHSVLTFKNNAISLLIRGESLMLAVHDRVENGKLEERNKERQLALLQAEEDRRLAEAARLEALAIEARRREIAEESTF